MTPPGPQGPTRRSDVSQVRIGTEGIVYDPVSGTAHRLNATGMLVWDLCYGTKPVDAIVAELVEAFGERADDIDDSVQALIGEFADQRLLATATPDVTPAGLTPPGAATDLPAHRPLGDPSRRLGPYRALDVTVVVECHDADGVADELERILRPLETMIEPGADDPVSFTVWNDDEWHIDVEQQRQVAGDASLVADFVMFNINWLAFQRSSSYLVLHASAVARDGVAVVMPAIANSGKSTLATGLIAAGFDYLTDEATAIDLDTGTIVGYPKSLTLDPGSQRLLPDLEPSGLTGRSQKWYVAPDAIRAGSVTRRARLEHLVFPTHAPGADNLLVPIDTIDATVALVSHAFNLPIHGHRLAEIVELVERCTVS